MKWSVNLFGAFRVTSPQGVAFQTKSDRFRILLAYLSGQPSLQADRHTLHDALFGVEELSGSTGFRVLLARGVAALATLDSITLIVATRRAIELFRDNFESDLGAFEAQIEQARSHDDPLVSSLAWHRALEIAQARPFDDLDHPVLHPIRQRIASKVLESAVQVATGPLGMQSRSLVLDRLRAFDLEHTPDAPSVEALMRIYAALGMKDELTQTFSSYESALEFEYGEKVPALLVDVFEHLLSAMDQPRIGRRGTAPERPAATIGREEPLRHLLQATEARDNSGRLTTLTGQSGIGKSHLLRALFWSYSPSVQVAYFDLESQPTEVIGKLLAGSGCDVALIDHVLDSHASLVGQWMRSQPNVRFVCASHSRLGLSDESLMTLGPLELGDAAHPGAAIALLELGIQHVHQERSISRCATEDHLLELASLCDGIPLALEIAGRLSGSIGVRATIGSLRRNLDGLISERQGATRKSSLRNAIASSYENLGCEARRLVAFLAILGGRCHIDHLLECAESVPCDLEEGILSGLVVREQRGTYVRVLRSTAASLEGVFELEPLAAFRLRSIDWFRARGAELPLDLEIAASLPLAVEMANRLRDEGSLKEALSLFSTLRPWLGSHPLAASQLEPIERALLESPPDHHDWPAALLTLAAGYFHTGAYGAMRDVLAHALANIQPNTIPSDELCQLTMQAGLAETALGNADGGIGKYRQALEEADDNVSDATRVKCYYNLGALLEGQDRLEESLKAHESASHHFTAETDPRVESLVHAAIGRLLYRLGGDLASAALILEATLAQARTRKDRRAAAEILQNLGMIYAERGMFDKAAFAQSVGTSMLLEFGYNEEFRRLSKSSFVTLCQSLFELGLDDLAHVTRSMIDRLGDAPFYTPDQLVYNKLAAKTYVQPSSIRLALATETEVREHLLICLTHLQGADLPLGQPWEVAGIVLDAHRGQTVPPSRVAREPASGTHPR